MNIIEKIKANARVFQNGVVILNTTPHDITIQDMDGSLISVPSDPDLILNAEAVEEEVNNLLVTTKFVGIDDGFKLIKIMFDALKQTGTVIIIGSIIAMNAYPGLVKGMIPVPGFERVPPDQKRMRCDKFNVAFGQAVKRFLNSI